MDWKVFLSTFLTIFIAEIGDKTQVAAVAISASHSSKWSVFFGVVIALACAGGLGVLVGSVLSQYIDLKILNRVSGGLLIVMGSWLLLRG